MPLPWESLQVFTRRAANDLLNRHDQPHPPERHLSEAVAWLERAHDATPDDGVSYGYALRGGWRPSYRETSGYISPTFYDLAVHYGRPHLRDRAERVARWLLTVQNPDGSFSNPRYGTQGIVFDTGQDIFGLVRGYEETKDPALLDGARRAGQWLVRIADETGRWTRNTHNGIPHVYNSRSAWALLELHRVEPHADFERVARANLDWAVSQQHRGYFSQCAFTVGAAPFTHTIAYAIRGLLESARLLDDARYRACATEAAEAMLSHVRADGFIAGQIDEHGVDRATYCCLTGNCQLAIIWFMLAKSTGDDRYRQAALKALDFVMATQDLTTSDTAIRGAIKGSQPVWGRYAPLSYPNWATKFFIDAMLLRAEATDAPAKQDEPGVRILNGEFRPVTLRQTVEQIMHWVRSGDRGYVCTVNVAILMMMRHDPWLQGFVERARLVVADGQPLVWTSRLMPERLPERVTGVDLVEALCERAAADKVPVYFLGATQEVIDTVAQRLREKFPGLVCVTADGYFTDAEAPARAEAVARSGAKILFVGMGVPRQEHFLEEQWDKLGCTVAIGVGGSFDVLAGLRARAPQVVQRLGMEWAFRLVQEPRRLFRRYLVTNSEFVYLLGRQFIDKDRDR